MEQRREEPAEPYFRDPEARRRNSANPVASIIIVNYNGGDVVLKCLRSLGNSSAEFAEVIVVDNASVDGSPDEIAATFQWVTLVRSCRNLGFGDGNNLGVSHSSGRYLAFLNPDTVVEPSWLEYLVNAIEADPEVGLATSRILLHDDPNRINTCGNDLHFTGITLCRGLSLDRDALPVPEDVTAVSGAAFAIRRDLFEALGGFDGSFFLYMEDTDLSLRARLAGFRCRYVPDSIVYHHYELRIGSSKIFYQERNRYLMLCKGLRWPTLVALTPGLIAAEIVTWGFVILKYPSRSLSKLQAYAWVVRNRRQILDARRATQATRQVTDRNLLASCSHRIAIDQTDQGRVARVAQATLNPVFSGLMRATLAVVRW